MMDKAKQEDRTVAVRPSGFNMVTGDPNIVIEFEGREVLLEELIENVRNRERGQ